MHPTSIRAGRCRWLSLAVLTVLAATIGVGWAGAASVKPGSDHTEGRAPGPSIDRGSVVVLLRGEPLATSPRTRPTGGKKVDFDSAAVRAERANLAAARNDFKAWLRRNAARAKVTSEYDIALNAVAVQLNGESSERIATSPSVQRVEYEQLYYPTDDNDPDLGVINAIEAWRTAQVGGDANAGRGVKVAVIDSGIDPTHPCFSDAGYPAHAQLGDTHFTNNKVIAAKVFFNRAKVRNLTPAAVDSHGTHVAGTVACNLDTPASVDGVDIPYDLSGVAPAALLGNYNVFPGDVSTVRDQELFKALETAYADGFDVANMSIGGTARGGHDLASVAVDNLDQANMVVAVSAGNSGPGAGTVESPGRAARALTAGASTVPHFVGAPVSVGASTIDAAAGDFDLVQDDLTAPLEVVAGSVNGLSTACTALPAGSLVGRIAVISRGTCLFSEKIRHTEDAGAVAALVANDSAGDPIAMGRGGIANEPMIPAYGVGLADVAFLIAHNGGAATIGAGLAYFTTTNGNIMAAFSSQGPTPVEYRVKPDVVAPGVNVLSAIPAHACDTPPCFAFFQGTSMAAPHLAGTAAVLRGAHPNWTAAAIRSAIVNTASQGVLRDFETGNVAVTDGNIVGAGLENVLSATSAPVALDPVSASFGAVDRGVTRSATITLTNLTGAPATLSLSVEPATGSGVTFSAPTSLTIPAGASAPVTLDMTVAVGAATGAHQAMLVIGNGSSEVAHAVLFTFVRP